MTEKERLLAVLAGEPVDRAPFIGPGGMMTIAISEVMEASGYHWPEAHSDPVAMAGLGKAMHDLAGVENVGVPFCLTVEAEAMGAPVDLGTRETEPRITDYAIIQVDQFKRLNGVTTGRNGRVETALEALRILAREAPDTPAIGNLTGPISLATSLIDPLTFFKSLRTNAKSVHEFLAFITESLVEFGRAQIEAGADIVVIADPTGTGEILGPEAFREFALPYLNRIVAGLGDPFASRTIVHICGRVQPIAKELAELRAAGLSVDSMVSVEALRRDVDGKVLVGNVSTYLLDKGPAERIFKAGRRCLESGVQILAPACGISANTKLEHIRALARAARGEIDADA